MNLPRPIAWALDIPLKGIYRSTLLTLAGRGEEDGVCIREMRKLCYETRIEHPQTMRKILGRMERVGLLTRESRPGPGAKQVIRLAINVSPRELTARIDADPYLGSEWADDADDEANARPAALDNARPAALNTTETSAEIGRRVALDSQTSARNRRHTAPDELETSAEIGRQVALVSAADQSRMRACAVGNNSPGSNREDELNHTSTPVSGGVPFHENRQPGGAWRNGTTHDAPPPRSGGTRELREPTDDERRQLHDAWDASFPKGAEDVDRRIRNAYGNGRRNTWDDPLRYLDNWLSRDAESLQRLIPAVSAAAAEGRLKDVDAPPRESRYAKYRNTNLDTGLAEPRAAS